MQRTNMSLVVVMAAGLVSACGGDDGGRESASASASTTVTATITASDGSTTQDTPTGSASESGTTAGSVSDSLTGTSVTTGPVTSTTDTTGAVSITGTDSDPGTTTSTSTSTTEPGTTTNQMPADMGDPCAGGMGGDPEFSYIWIANSSQGTISKIDTQTLVEKGRYIVRPDSAGSPSRTSVNLTGDVVVANRSGGMAKVFARVADCVESNGMPGIQTSTDSNVLPWGVEECVAWYTPLSYVSQRPAAWTQGTFNKQTCGWDNQKVWSSGVIDAVQPGVDILRLNGATGVVEDKINIPTINHGYYGIYGAAVDKAGNMWGSQLGQGQLLFVDGQTMQYKTWPMVAGGYGMTVGASGYVWTCSTNASRFDPMTEQWITMSVGGSGGCMEDDNGTLFMSASGGGVVAVDVETLQVKANYPLPEYVHGISIDYYGYVWGVSIGANAYRVDIMNNGAFDTFTGLVGAYTYSDMTGFALANVSPQ